ncbi:PrpF domain-containing protein [Haloarchaeobius sp. HRN-SO-5]|uniref:PrpF domain-containing protein n=1 Tax=Haloarchaeobius sp. HRN-SO-5 TaxID=3446118 RepID=UPI003EC081FE
MTQESLPATLFRGGTSKGVYFRESDMPEDRDDWDDLLLTLYGSPDPMQLDGIGGSHSTTSKAMIVSESDEDDVDVDYLFGQVGVENPVVDWGGNCGNLSFAIGPFALERDLATADTADGRASLVLRNSNTGTVVEQSIPVEDGTPRYDGDFKVYGVPGTGGRITSRFLDPGGSVTGEVFPTGTRTDTLDVDGVGDIEVSLVDVSSPCVFARAADLGMDATELPDEVNADPDLLDRLERVRSAACERYGFVTDRADATAESPGIPKMAVVGERQPYETVGGESVTPDDYDLLARIMSMQKPHHAYAVTGAMCTAVAAAVPGTIPSEYLDAERPDRVVLGHPKGTMGIGVGLDGETVTYTEAERTARQIMHGDLYYVPR